MSKYTKNIVVCINKFNTDTEDEIDYIINYVKEMGYEVDICDSYSKGAEGSISLAKKIINVCNNEVDYKQLYDYNTSIGEKINIICKEIYRASNVIISNEIREKIKVIEDNGFGDLPICIAKTQYSFSDNPKLIGAPNNFDMTVTDIRLSSGAGFVVVLMGNIMTMPGLGKNSAYLNMNIDNNGNIKGIF